MRLSGVVQGVGMRPFVHGLARRHGLAGFVLNDAEGVAIEVEGDSVAGFLDGLAHPPALARIDRRTVQRLPPAGEAGFEIRASRAGRTATRIGADAATCADCLRDLFDPSSRFFHYPFVNCTSCGPRYTIARRLPYDRAQTAMAGFAMCPDCARDYADPENRRFHAEPIACPACGPRLDAPVPAIAAALCAGSIVAVKGIGGFHLMCDARNEAAVAALRRRKQRDAKPFAVMVADRDALDSVAAPTTAERALAEAPARPVVLVAARAGALAPSVAPGLRQLGVMLPYAPLHHLMFAAAPPGLAIVATSANPGGEPLVVDDADARHRLAGIADLIVGHDRPIVVRADDSVRAVIDGAPAFLRRARGFVPDPVDLGRDGPPILAVGAYLKATVTVTRGREAFVSQHIGDLDTAETRRFYRETVAHLLAILDVVPERVVADLHPDYASTQFALAQGLPVLRVQHHAAHVAAVAAEHGLHGPVLGLALDGVGLGSDGAPWGGELLELDGAEMRRLGHLAPLAMPGGDRAAREPWRMAASALAALGRARDIPQRFTGEPLAAPLAALLARGGAMPRTSSLGRLFDAAAGLLGLRLCQDHEAQAAMELEALVRTPCILDGGFVLRDGVLDFAPLLAALAEPDMDRASGADLFHGTVAAGLAALAVAAARRLGHERVALGGGCMANCVLAESLCAGLREAGITPLLARAVPPNDGGLSLGQAAMAAS